MEERRTNKHGLDLALSFRKEKFWHFSGIMWLSRACTRTKFPRSYQERWLILSRWLTWLLGSQVPTTHFSSRTLSDRRLSLTIANSHLLTVLGPCLYSSSSELVGNLTSPLCGFRAKTDKGILWLALTHTHRTNAHHRATTIWTYNVLDILISRHKITLDRWTWR